MIFKRKAPDVSHRQAGDMDYTLVRTSRKTLALQVKSGGELVVRAPHRTPLREIEDWIFEKRKWITRHQQKSRKKAEKTPRFEEGALHPFMGEDYSLHIQRGSRAAVDLIDGALLVTLRGEATPDKIEASLKGFYAVEAKTLFEDRLDELFPPFSERGHKRPPIKLRWMKSRWGSMSHSGKMSLNTQLIKHEVALIDYVIVHELCHLEHMNHGKGFYRLMDQMLPGWKVLRKQLKGEL